ncbi:HD domain-containing protein [Lentiprolixibacter aurantiacus]|uniref:HD domain-containing protein n=1 Tax=Lentiprolixibacter aurantiacus TaxID=2993939 RepID=A0AAE3MJ75_9FLAO|nr:HD domain-containing protein [Lentiprolixibacter aurantiacus]MCX2718685.1 HD domain-containing protein [Lentiprolixibacter aurantiacus]
MTPEEILQATQKFVKESLEGAEGGHDWWHTLRVYRTALLIAEGEKADLLTVGMGALLHDIADAKFHDGDETIGPRIATSFMRKLELPETLVNEVSDIVRNISFKNSLGTQHNKPKSKALEIVQDADRLDAIGAIGVARAFNYGGFRNRPLYDPEIKPLTNMSKDIYKKAKGPTINHFYEKLLTLKDRMNTRTGKKLAEQRHQFMLDFLEQFYKEWEGAG